MLPFLENCGLVEVMEFIWWCVLYILIYYVFWINNGVFCLYVGYLNLAQVCFPIRRSSWIQIPFAHILNLSILWTWEFFLFFYRVALVVFACFAFFDAFPPLNIYWQKLIEFLDLNLWFFSSICFLTFRCSVFSNILSLRFIINLYSFGWYDLHVNLMCG